MKTQTRKHKNSKTFTFEEYKRAFFPFSKTRPIPDTRSPGEVGLGMAKMALLELQQALKASVAREK